MQRHTPRILEGVELCGHLTAARSRRATKEIMNRRLPQRIVCLTTETVEVLYLLGEADELPASVGYTVRPPQARKEMQGLCLHQR